MGRSAEAAPPAVPSFNEGWYDDCDLRVLRAAAASVQVDGDFIELGSWEGRSLCALATVTNRPILGVDSWVVGGCYPRDVFLTCVANVAAFPQIVLRRQDVLEFMRAYTGRLAFLHVDAAHDYDHVLETLKLALPRLVPGGVLCGHDIRAPDVERAVRDALGTYNAAENVWTYTSGCSNH